MFSFTVISHKRLVLGIGMRACQVYSIIVQSAKIVFILLEFVLIAKERSEALCIWSTSPKLDKPKLQPMLDMPTTTYCFQASALLWAAHERRAVCVIYCI